MHPHARVKNEESTSSLDSDEADTLHLQYILASDKDGLCPKQPYGGDHLQAHEQTSVLYTLTETQMLGSGIFRMSSGLKSGMLNASEARCDGR